MLFLRKSILSVLVGKSSLRAKRMPDIGSLESHVPCLLYLFFYDDRDSLVVRALRKQLTWDHLYYWIVQYASYLGRFVLFCSRSTVLLSNSQKPVAAGTVCHLGCVLYRLMVVALGCVYNLPGLGG